LIDAHLTDGDFEILESASGTGARTLIDALKSAPVRVLHKFFSEDRFVFDAELNRMGMHVLRSMLAEKVIDSMRRAKGYHRHPDYARFMRDGVLMKDFSAMTNQDLIEILMMVSGYSRDMIPDISWELRPVYHQNSSHDLNQDLHVDTYHASIKVWLYAENVTADKGPFTVVRGSHTVSLAKAKFLHRVSTHLVDRGPESYGSFRLLEGDDETQFGFPKREGLVGPAMTLLVADTVALHARGISVPGAVRRTFVLRGKNNDGGLRRRNPFVLARESEEDGRSVRTTCEMDTHQVEHVRRASLLTYDLDKAIVALRNGLEENYAEVDVRAVPCPDLRLWGQASPGISGKPRLCEIGGEQFMHNPRYNGRSGTSKAIEFSIDKVAAAVGLPNAFVLGAGGACNDALRGHGGELMHSAVVPQLRGAIASKAMRVDDGGNFVLEHYHSLRNGGLGNLFLSEGRPGTVLRVEVKRRTGEIGSFAQALREALRAQLLRDGGGESHQAGLGGVFQILDGSVKTHVQPDWGSMPSDYFDTNLSRVVKSFLHFFDSVTTSKASPLVCASTLWTGDPTGGDLHLRSSGEHTHCYAEDGSGGGHYHHDNEPESAHYVGYFTMAESIYRIGDDTLRFERDRESRVISFATRGRLSGSL